MKLGSVFFLDCEDGNDGVIEGLEVCNLSGWLIPKDKVNEFEKVWEREEEDDDWSDFICLVRWREENGIKLSFD